MNCDGFSERIVMGNRTRQLLTYSKWMEIRVNELTKQMEYNTRLDPECNTDDIIISCCNPFEFANNSVLSSVFA